MFSKISTLNCKALLFIRCIGFQIYNAFLHVITYCNDNPLKKVKLIIQWKYFHKHVKEIKILLHISKMQ